MKLTRAIYDTPAQKTLDFIIGYLSWFVINTVANGALYLVPSLIIPVLSSATGYEAIQSILGGLFLVCNLLVLLLNIGALIYFAFTRYWIALGALAAFATLLVLAICASLLFLTACFVVLTGMGR